MDVKVMFGQRLEAALAESEIQSSIRLIRPREGEPSAAEQVKTAVEEQREDLLREVEAHTLGRDHLAELVEHIDEWLQPYISRRRWLARSAGAGLVMAAVGGAALVIAGGLPDLLFLDAIVAYFCLLVVLGYYALVERARRIERVWHRQLDAAEARLQWVVRQEVTAAVRRVINARLRSMATTFSIVDARGLRELSGSGREVSTKATKDLRTLMSSLDGGSIGLAGARGCGKTTLIHRFASGGTLLAQGSDLRGLVVSAPVRYDAREFVLHLFAQVCERVLQPAADPPPPPGRRERMRLARIEAYARLLSAVALLAGAAGVTILLTKQTAPHGPQETAAFLLAIAGLCFVLAVIITRVSIPEWLTSLGARIGVPWLMSGRTARSVEDWTGAQTLAEDRLEDIRFQQTVASGWSGGLGLPFGVKLGIDEKLTLARTPWSLPEAVDEFRRYIAEITKSHYLVIGIDELDKMESEEAARQFLNDIKGVFGVRRCFYLVSVSEDAMSSFERRGLPFRDVFDSSFDAIQQVGYLTLEESVEVLESRATGLPVPYLCLCHCLAGGLPRDLIRVARELVGRRQQTKLVSLRSLSSELVARDLRAKAHAAAFSIRTVAGARRDWLLSWIQRLEEAGSDFVTLRDRSRELAEWSGLRAVEGEAEGDRQLREIAVELMAFAYYSASVLEFFGDDDRLMAFLDDDDAPFGLAPAAVAAVESLAASRQQFSLSSTLAIHGVTRFRAATWLGAWG